MTMPDLQHLTYGAPATLWLNVSVLPDATVALDLQVCIRCIPYLTIVKKIQCLRMAWIYMLLYFIEFLPSCVPTMQMFNKTATRLGEAHFFHFLPAPQAGDYSWMMDK